MVHALYQNMGDEVANPVDIDTVDDAPERVQGLVQCTASHLQEHYNCIAFLKSMIW